MRKLFPLLLNNSLKTSTAFVVYLQTETLLDQIFKSYKIRAEKRVLRFLGRRGQHQKLTRNFNPEIFGRQMKFLSAPIKRGNKSGANRVCARGQEAEDRTRFQMPLPAADQQQNPPPCLSLDRKQGRLKRALSLFCISADTRG